MTTARPGPDPYAARRRARVITLRPRRAVRVHRVARVDFAEHVVACTCGALVKIADATGPIDGVHARLADAYDVHRRETPSS